MQPVREQRSDFSKDAPQCKSSILQSQPLVGDGSISWIFVQDVDVFEANSPSISRNQWGIKENAEDVDWQTIVAWLSAKVHGTPLVDQRSMP